MTGVGDSIVVADEFYIGSAVILEVGESPLDGIRRPWYCHLLNNCDHAMCEPDDDCDSEDCRGWYGPGDVVVGAES